MQITKPKPVGTGTPAPKPKKPTLKAAQFEKVLVRLQKEDYEAFEDRIGYDLITVEVMVPIGASPQQVESAVCLNADYLAWEIVQVQRVKGGFDHDF